MDLQTSLVLALGALAIEAAFGYPQRLYRVIGHPVTWMGALIAWLDRRLNREKDDPATRRRKGIAALAVLLTLTALAAMLMTKAVVDLPDLLLIPGLVALAAVASSLIAQRSLNTHVRAVAEALEQDGLAAGRRAVSKIVGRDPDSLDEAGVARAAIESLAENFSDGVVAPLLWLAVGGLPAGALYKAVNTADSMIGHRTPRHLAFGWAAARLDDLVNLPASRLAGGLIVAAAWITPGMARRRALPVMLRDAPGHRSPNAGWPEAAMAGALGVSLAGPRRYHGTEVADRWMGEGRSEATARDIRRALRLYRVACALQFLGLAGLTALAL